MRPPVQVRYGSPYIESLTQLVEYLALNQKVVGSIPTRFTILVLLALRLVVGHLTLTQVAVVRIHEGQPNIILSFDVVGND